MQAKGVAPEILRDKALSLQQLKRLAILGGRTRRVEKRGIVRLVMIRYRGQKKEIS
jgi:hypothetical protein